jgi:hypothetical protein
VFHDVLKRHGEAKQKNVHHEKVNEVDEVIDDPRGQKAFHHSPMLF